MCAYCIHATTVNRLTQRTQIESRRSTDVVVIGCLSEKTA